jgi:hypothetical protein
VPTTALPALKSAVVAPFAAFAETMKMLARSESSCGLGALVFTRIVWSSTFLTDSMPRVNCAKELGELGTLGTRSMVKITSSAVNGLPSWNTTPGRSLSSQVVLSTSFHEVASAGRISSLSPYSTSLSKKYCIDELVGKAAKKCGSSVLSSSLVPSVRFWAGAAVAASATSAAARKRFVIMFSILLVLPLCPTPASPSAPSCSNPTATPRSPRARSSPPTTSPRARRCVPTGKASIRAAR